MTSNAPATTLDLLIICHPSVSHIPFTPVSRSLPFGPKPVEHNSTRRGLASPLHFADLTYGMGNKQDPPELRGVLSKRMKGA